MTTAGETYLPHNFSQLQESPMIQYGTYYVLEPVQGAIASHVIKKSVYLPVTDTVSWSFNHTYNEADNLSKTIIDSIAQKGGMIGNQISKVAQRKIGGSVHVSSCAVYVDSAPPTINVKTKLFSPDGEGNILEMIELFRQDTHGSLGGTNVKRNLNSLAGSSGRNAAANIQSGLQAANDFANSAGGGQSVFQSGLIDHPEWWNISVVTFSEAGQAVLANMKDMLCKGMTVIFYAPFYNKEPSMIELDLQFQHGFRGLRESMSFNRQS